MHSCMQVQPLFALSFVTFPFLASFSHHIICFYCIVRYPASYFWKWKAARDSSAVSTDWPRNIAHSLSPCRSSLRPREPFDRIPTGDPVVLEARVASDILY